MAAQGNKLVHSLITFARNSPWMMIAIGIHLIVGAVLSLIAIKHTLQKSDGNDTNIGIAAARADALPEVVQPPEEMNRKKIPENQEAELVSYEEETNFVPTEEPEEQDLFQDLGDPTGADDGSTGETGGTSIGVGAGGHYSTGAPSAFASRRASKGGGRKKGRRPTGETEGTEEAVLQGLRWLIRHQNDDGSWGPDTLTQHCNPKTPCIPAEAEVTANYNEGLTGLALLAFLGHGFDQNSKIKITDTAMGTQHTVGPVVKKGIKWLMDRQKDDGSFSPERAYLYNEALATMALAEAYGLASKPQALRGPAQKAVGFLVAAQKLNELDELSGWRYGSRADLDRELAEGKIDNSTHYDEARDSDISVTCWVVMALKSARYAGLKVPEETMQGALRYARYVTGEDGLVGYTKPELAGQKIIGAGDHYAYHTGTMTALGMLVRTFITHELEDPFFDLGAKHIVKDLPDVSKDKLSIDYYYWYYATLALNQFDGPDSPRAGGGKFWEPWNKALQQAVLGLQNQSKEKLVCSRGGWLDDDRWSRHGYCIYNTAINVLTLEVYYRFENAFGAGSREEAGSITGVEKPR